MPYEKVAALGEASRFKEEKRTTGSIFDGIMIYRKGCRDVNQSDAFMD